MLTIRSVRYFHRAPTRSNAPAREPGANVGYRGGTRKGLDLTFGNPVTSPHFPIPESDESAPTRGGILLRTIRRVHDQKIISGPSLLVDEVLSVTQADGLVDLVQNLWQNNTSALTTSSTRTSYLYMKKRDKRNNPCHVYSTPRIGLELSHPSAEASATNPRVIYIAKPYRYIVHPNLLVANGRSQTFIGVYQICSDSGDVEDDDELAAQVAKVTGIKEKTVLNYMSDFKRGSEGKIGLKSFIGVKTSSVSKYLSLMGAVQATLAY